MVLCLSPQVLLANKISILGKYFKEYGLDAKSKETKKTLVSNALIRVYRGNTQYVSKNSPDTINTRHLVAMPIFAEVLTLATIRSTLEQKAIIDE